MELARASAEHRPALDAEARAAAGGDPAAFERLYRATVARVHGVARRILGREEADDATQEVYARLWRELGTWRGEAEVAAWQTSWMEDIVYRRVAQPAASPAEVPAAAR
jgi:RNA polymerase sigma-70 factor (ECF subfamily)